ncbi:DUF3048 N-terminal domain-containing protein [Paenibacillus sp. DMB20]|uniref:DUF3048 N-terminal domain-containing protein n=1 Tax=Paenibacillus sp. DMB20 TaxID=1642570 RepID=UPI0009E306B5|nr:DUF3048 domain-containing protein [Paenibacillus sp. DMB20]
MSNIRKSAWRTGLASIAAVTLLLSACGGKEKAVPVETPEVQAPVESPVETPPVKETAAFTAPLTGMPLKEASSRRPLSVMINNAPAARPQSGLSKADIVYEVLAEGGITRLIAIYQSQTGIEKIGPIRSIRPYLINIGESYGGVLVHAGGSPEAYSIIKKQGKQDMDEIGNAGAYFWRTKDRKAPHNLYSSDEKLREGAAKLKYAAEAKIPAYTFIKEENDQEVGTKSESGTDGTDKSGGENGADKTSGRDNVTEKTESGSVNGTETAQSGENGAKKAENSNGNGQAKPAGRDNGSKQAENSKKDDKVQPSALLGGEPAAKVDITFLLKGYVVATPMTKSPKRTKDPLTASRISI